MAFTGEEPKRTTDSIRDSIRTQKNDSQLPKPCIHIRVGLVGVRITGVGIAGAPRAICIHTTASFPTSNGFSRLKRFKQSTEEWTMNCKNSAQNTLKVAIFRLKIFSLPLSRSLPYWGGKHPLPPRRLRRLDTPACGARPLGASILAPWALDLASPRLQILDPTLVACETVCAHRPLCSRADWSELPC